MSSARQLQTGGTYQLPPQPQGIEPDLSESFDSWQQNITQAAQMVSGQTGQPALLNKGMVRAYQVLLTPGTKALHHTAPLPVPHMLDTRFQCRHCAHFWCPHDMPLISTCKHACVPGIGNYHLMHASLQYTAHSGLVVQKSQLLPADYRLQQGCSLSTHLRKCSVAGRV